MGKGDRRNKARKNQDAFEAAVALAPVARPKSRGKRRAKELAAQRAADHGEANAALEARARMMGIGMLAETKDDGKPDTKAMKRNGEARRVMRIQAMGCAAGRVIYLAHKGQDAADLWAVAAGLFAAEGRYHRVVLGTSMFPKTAKVEFMPETFAASPEDDGPDLRSDDEKHRDAVNSWMHWRGLVGHLPSQMQTALFDVLMERAQPNDGMKVLPAGHRFLAALSNLKQVVDMRG